jgi:hypothetical protein
MATHVNGNDGFGARSDGGFRKLGINAIGFERNVDHDRKRTRIEDSTRCGDKGEVGKNDFIARANAERGHRDFQSGGAVGNGDAELRAVKSGKLLFEGKRAGTGSSPPNAAFENFR